MSENISYTHWLRVCRNAAIMVLENAIEGNTLTLTETKMVSDDFADMFASQEEKEDGCHGKHLL